MKIVDEDIAMGIWAAHKHGTPLAGCHIKGIAEGNVCNELSELQDLFDQNEMSRDAMGFEEWKEERE
jgi:hypothetical protein